MTSSAIVIGVAVAYLLGSLMVGMWPGRKTSDSAEGFVAGDRSLGLVVMYFITGATIFSSFPFLGAPGFAYEKGASVFYIIAYGVLGFVPFYFLGPRAARLGYALFCGALLAVCGAFWTVCLDGLGVKTDPKKVQRRSEARIIPKRSPNDPKKVRRRSKEGPKRVSRRSEAKL